MYIQPFSLSLVKIFLHHVFRLDRNGFGSDACDYIVKIVRKARNLKELEYVLVTVKFVHAFLSNK